MEEASILQVAKSLLPMLKNQVRFKPDELAAALDNSCYSRWLIAPSRSKPNDSGDERYAIATGVLGGFGGFLDIKFRAHDYQLGRRWFAGARLDQSNHAGDVSLSDTGQSLLLTFKPTEFSLVRGQYRRTKYALGETAHEVLFQFLFAIGAHGAHPF